MSLIWFLLGFALGAGVILSLGRTSKPQVESPSEIPSEPEPSIFDGQDWRPGCAPRWCQTADLRRKDGVLQQRYVFQSYAGENMMAEEWRDVQECEHPTAEGDKP